MISDLSICEIFCPCSILWGDKCIFIFGCQCYLRPEARHHVMIVSAPRLLYINTFSQPNKYWAETLRDCETIIGLPGGPFSPPASYLWSSGGIFKLDFVKIPILPVALWHPSNIKDRTKRTDPLFMGQISKIETWSPFDNSEWSDLVRGLGVRGTYHWFFKKRSTDSLCLVIYIT